jgi:hypothetical protein
MSPVHGLPVPGTRPSIRRATARIPAFPAGRAFMGMVGLLCTVASLGAAQSPATTSQGSVGAAVRGPEGSRPQGNQSSATIGAMKDDLRRLVSANEVYRARNGHYATSIGALQGYHASTGVVVSIQKASSTGWAADATSQSLPGKSCVVFIGAMASPSTLADKRSGSEAVVACDNP